MANAGEINQQVTEALSTVYREQSYFRPQYYGSAILDLHEQGRQLNEVIGDAENWVAGAEGSRPTNEPMEGANTVMRQVASGSDNEHLLAAAEATAQAAEAMASLVGRHPAVQEQWRTYFELLKSTRTAGKELQALLRATKEDSEKGNAACETALDQGERFLPYV